jgi:hypothetical protein
LYNDELIKQKYFFEINKEGKKFRQNGGKIIPAEKICSILVNTLFKRTLYILARIGWMAFNNIIKMTST